MSVAPRHRNITAVIREEIISHSNLTGCWRPFCFSAGQVKIVAQKTTNRVYFFLMTASIDAAEKRFRLNRYQEDHRLNGIMKL